MPTNPPLASRRKLVGATIETTSGNMATVTAALAGTVIYDAVASPDDFYGDGQRQPQGHYQGTTPAVIGVQTGKLTFRTELIHSDALLTLLQGCGFGLSLSVATPESDLASRKTLSMKLWEDGRVKALAGCSGTVTIEAQAGKRVFANWEFTGVWQPVVDAALPAMAPIANAGYRAASMTLTLGGAATAQLDGFSLNLNNEVAPRQTVANAQGVQNYIITERAPVLTIEPEARLVAQSDAYGLLLSGATAAVNLVLTDASANTLTIGAPKAQRIAITDTDRDKKLVDSIEVALHASAGDDELTFTQS